MIFNINIERDYNRRKQSFIVSIFLPGLGQLLNKRKSGFFFIITNLLLIIFLLYLHKYSIFKNGLIILGFFTFYIINLLDSFMGPYKKKAPCQLACPADINVSEYIALIADRRFEEAKAIIKRKMPFVSVCGTICHAPCEIKCLRSGYDSSVMIMDLKKSTINKKESITNLNIKKTDKKIAIIGAGPGGLSLAYFLAKKGINVTLYEREKEAGGLLRYGIPKYRLDMLDVLMDIESILSHKNIEIITEKNIGKDYPLKSIIDDFDFTILAIGRHKPIKPFENMLNSKRMLSGFELLKQLSQNNIVDTGKRTVVIGGGNVAIDAARSAKRLGSDVVIFYRKEKSLMRAIPEEIKMAEEEGIRIFDNSIVNHIEEIENGLYIIVSINGEEKKVFTNTFICATGQKEDISQFDINILLGKNYKTNINKVFNLNDAGTIVDTVKNAQILSRHIIRKIFGLHGILYNIIDKKNYYPDIREINDAAWLYNKPRKINRVNTTVLPIDKRLNSFFKVKRNLTEDETIVQAKRCLRCHTKNRLPFYKEIPLFFNKRNSKEKLDD